MKLASIEKILEVKEHPNADALEIAKVKGWNVVVKKGEFKAGDFCIYVQVDSILPETEDFEFLRKNNFRIKPIKLRGVMSQGIAFPISIYCRSEFATEGRDLTESLNIKKYEKPVPIGGEQAGPFPTHFVPKTDEERLQNFPEVFEEFKGKRIYISIKHDGTSATYINDRDHFFVCSRNWEMKEGGNAYWKIVEKFDLKNPDVIPEGCAIQGEIVGPKIQKNPEGLTELKFRIFNIFNYEYGERLNSSEIALFCKVEKCDSVDFVYCGDFNFESIQELEEFAAKQKYANGKIAEGIVLRADPVVYSEVLGGPLSVKIVNPEYAAKE